MIIKQIKTLGEIMKNILALNLYSLRIKNYFSTLIKILKLEIDIQNLNINIFAGYYDIRVDCISNVTVYYKDLYQFLIFYSPHLCPY